MQKVIVNLENFSKSYGDKKIIDNINLEVYEGEFLTLLGSSGCGKTTILRAISGLDNPTSGKVFIDGEDVTFMEARKRKVNTIFQNYALFPLMTIEENVAFGLKMQKVSQEEINKKVKDMLKLVHLEGYEKRKPKQLSGGEQQRVAIIRGLINNPKVLLLDEPLSALDLKLRKKMQIELKTLQRKLGITFIYVTHDQDEAMQMSDRIVVLKDGKIKQIGSPTEVYEHPKNLYVADFLGEANIFEAKVAKNNIALINNEKVILEKPVQEKEKINIIVRPENIKLSKTLKKENCFKAVITNQIYDGAFTKIHLKWQFLEVKALISGNDKLYKTGQDIYFYWTKEDAIVLGKENS